MAMDDTVLLVLKYVTWALTVGTAFAGSWLFEFTKVDKDTGKKALTAWGRRGIVFAGLSLVCALVLTIWTDREAARKQTESAKQIIIKERQAEDEKREAISYREKFDRSLADTNQVVRFISENFEKLSPEQRREAGQLIEKLSTGEDLKRQYPDLYQRLIAGAPITAVVGEAVVRKAKERIRCRDLPVTQENADAYPSATFALRRSDRLQNLALMVTADGVDFTMYDFGGANDLRQGYSFEFADGTISPKLACMKSKVASSCGESTASSSSAKSIYQLLQTKQVARVRMNRQTYAVDPETSQAILRSFACITP
jgi:hypothetical protein